MHHRSAIYYYKAEIDCRLSISSQYFNSCFSIQVLAKERKRAEPLIYHLIFRTSSPRRVNADL